MLRHKKVDSAYIFPLYSSNATFFFFVQIICLCRWFRSSRMVETSCYLGRRPILASLGHLRCPMWQVCLDKHAIHQQSRSVEPKIWWIERVYVPCVVLGRRFSALRCPHANLCQSLPTERMPSPCYNSRASSWWSCNLFHICQYIPTWLVWAPHGRQTDSTVWSRGLHKSLLPGSAVSRWIYHCPNLAREESHLSQPGAPQICEFNYFDYLDQRRCIGIKNEPYIISPHFPLLFYSVSFYPSQINKSK